MGTPRERVKCECGKVCDLEEVIMDEDGNYQCAECQEQGAEEACDICNKPLTLCTCD